MIPIKYCLAYRHISFSPSRGPLCIHGAEKGIHLYSGLKIPRSSKLNNYILHYPASHCRCFWDSLFFRSSLGRRIVWAFWGCTPTCVLYSVPLPNPTIMWLLPSVFCFLTSSLPLTCSRHFQFPTWIYMKRGWHLLVSIFPTIQFKLSCWTSTVNP